MISGLMPGVGGSDADWAETMDTKNIAAKAGSSNLKETLCT
jgi:hypothetical protein